MSNVLLKEVPNGSSGAQAVRYRARSQRNRTDFQKDPQDLSDEDCFVQKEVVPDLPRPRTGKLRNRADSLGDLKNLSDEEVWSHLEEIVLELPGPRVGNQGSRKYSTEELRTNQGPTDYRVYLAVVESKEEADNPACHGTQTCAEDLTLGIGELQFSCLRRFRT
jgi:hypothetical protein